jgi:LysR family transcriptional regulator, glycine cleavage system transcriptional activator
MKFRKLPPLGELAAFEAIARHRSFTKASKELFLTPSALSQRLRHLEEHLDTRLLVRTRRSVELTTEGARYLEAVREALSKLAVASERFSASRPRRLRLGIVPALASNWLIYRLRSFHQRYPKIDLDIQSAIAMAKIEAGEVDIAIRWGRGNWPGLEQFKLFPDELLAVCSPAYLKEVGVGVLRAPKDLEKAVLLRNAIQPWKPWFEKAGLAWPEPAHGPAFNDSTLALQAAADGLGIALGRRMLVQHLLEDGSLVQLFDIAAPIEEAFFVVYLEESLQRPEVAAFLEWIESVAEEERRATNSIK